MLPRSCFYKNLYQIKVTEYKVNVEKISRMGEYRSSDKSNQNERRRNTFKTIEFMDRKPIRNRKKVSI